MAPAAGAGPRRRARRTARPPRRHVVGAARGLAGGRSRDPAAARHPTAALADVVERNRELAEVALRPREPVFVHGDLQVEHVFTAGDDVTGILDWSEGGSGDAQYDLAVLTLGYRDRLPDVVEGYGSGADPDAVRGWWSARSLSAIRWLVEHGLDPAAPGCEIDVLRAQVR